MSIFKIIKKAPNSFWHLYNNGSKEVNLSDFEVVLDLIAQTFNIQCLNGANIPNQSVEIVNIRVIDQTDGSLEETFANVIALKNRLTTLGYTPYKSSTGIEEAPVDGNTYGRKDEGWIIITGGTGSQTLAETLVLGNITDGTDISISDGDKILLDNGANLKKGTTDAGLGGSKGIALRCAVDYELKWEAGRLYVMGGDGFTIREVSHNFTTTPTVNDDDTKGFIVDSRWILDNGDVYVCTDDTTGAAVWVLQSSGIPTLQEVLDNNHDLVDGNNFQGTSAGIDNTGGQVNGFGSNAALENTGNNINALGDAACSQNSGSAVNALGDSSAQQNTGDNVNTLGYYSGSGNIGTDLNALGSNAAADNEGNSINALGSGAANFNTGNSLNALGSLAGYSNTGNNVNALGEEAGLSNAFNHVNLFGQYATADEDGQTVLSKDGAIMARISTTDLTDTRKYTLQDDDGTLAFTSDIPIVDNNPTNLSPNAVSSNGVYYALSLKQDTLISATNIKTINGNSLLGSGNLVVGGGGGAGASVSFYLNGSVSQGTIGGIAFREMDRTPILGAGTDFTINANGYIQSFITDANVPNQLEIPAGNWNFETYFSASSGGGSPSFYVELYKWNGTTLSLIASNSASPRLITDGTNIEAYFSALAVPQTTLLATDRLAIRIYVTHSGRTITLHTENSHLCQVITTFSTGLTALNGLTAQVQNLAVGTSGTDFAISSVTDTHTFNLPTASATNRGALSSTDWSAFNGKFTLPALTSGSVLFSNGSTIAQDNSNLFWDDTNNRLGIGTTSPIDVLDIRKNQNSTSVETTTTMLLSNTNENGIAAYVFTSDGTTRQGGLQYNNKTGFRNLFSCTYTDIPYNFGTNNIIRFRISATSGNVIIQNGGTFTDAGFRLDVSGTTRLNGNTSIGGATAGARLDVRAQGALSTDIAFRVRNSADSANLVSFAGNGNIIVNGVLNLTSPAIASTRENLLIAKISDNATDVFGIANGTFMDSRFVPAFYQYSNDSYGAINFRGLTSASGDTGSQAMMVFQSARTDNTTDPNNGTFSALSTRPLFSFQNQNTIHSLMFASGNLQLQNGGTYTDIASARLAVNSTTQGFLPPRMTTTQKNAIASPAEGLVVYDSTLQSLSNYNGTAWIGAVDDLQISLISQVYS
jgi:hypothetical protein